MGFNISRRTVEVRADTLQVGDRIRVGAHVYQLSEVVPGEGWIKVTGEGLQATFHSDDRVGRVESG